MRVKEGTAKAETGIRDIWEIRLDKKMIKTIRKTAEMRGTTMSWIARFCIFKLVHKKLIHRTTFYDMAMEIRASQPPCRELGRFYVCFYGNDILWVKMQADALNVTVSMLVRIALARYLPLLQDKNRIPWWRLFWYGIKINKSVGVYSLRVKRCLVQEFLNSNSYLPSEYWDTPPGPVPSYLTNP